jgi:3-hydroxyisobutyrate dehydrogenase
MMQGTFAPGFKLALHHKDLEICRAMTENAETPIPLAEMTLLNYKQLMDQGFGDEDISALYRLKKPRKFS